MVRPVSPLSRSRGRKKVEAALSDSGSEVGLDLGSDLDSDLDYDPDSSDSSYSATPASTCPPTPGVDRVRNALFSEIQNSSQPQFSSQTQKLSQQTQERASTEYPVR